MRFFLENGVHQLLQSRIIFFQQHQMIDETDGASIVGAGAVRDKKE